MEKIKSKENKNMDGKAMESEESKNMESKTMENNKKETVTKKQEKEYQNCLKVFEKSTKAWVEIAKAYDCLQKLPPVLWMDDVVIQGEKRPNVGKFLKAKYDISQGRLSQISGAYDARQQLEQAKIDGYETISCDALYEIFRFVNGKDNVKKMTVKEVYEAVRAVGAVSEKTVKRWRKQATSVEEGGKNKSVKNVFERLLQALDDTSNASFDEAAKETMDALKARCCDLLQKIKNANKTKTTKGNGGEENEKTAEREAMANVA